MSWIYLRHDKSVPIADDAGGFSANWSTDGWIWGQRAQITGFRDHDHAASRQFFRVRWKLRDASERLAIGDVLVDGEHRYEIIAIDGLGQLDCTVLTRTEEPNANI